MSEQAGTSSFTGAVADLEAAGFDSMGFAIEDGAIICMDCGSESSGTETHVHAMLRYQTDAGEGHVFALECPGCSAKGLLFVSGDALVGGTLDLVNELEASARI